MKRKWKQFFLIIGLLAVAFATYVEIVNRHSVNMNYRQKILKAFYPAFMWITRLTGKQRTQLSGEHNPPVPFYSLRATLNNGDTLDFAGLRGKKVLLVNTASECGYTNQYEDLQRLATTYPDKLVVIGFPANDFKEQEKGSDEEIAQFCKRNFGVTFPLAKKSSVIVAEGQNPVFQWLCDPGKNGWNNKAPSWNFSKYLVNEQGLLVHVFGPSISPGGPEIREAIELTKP